MTSTLDKEMHEQRKSISLFHCSSISQAHTQTDLHTASLTLSHRDTHRAYHLAVRNEMPPLPQR